MRIRWAAAMTAAGLLALLTGCAGEIGALSTSSLVVAPPTSAPETFHPQMDAARATVDGALEKVLVLLAEPHYFDDGWQEQLIAATTEADDGYQQLAELIPPEEARAEHEAVMQALNGCRALTILAQKGIENLDRAPFDDVTARATACRRELGGENRAPGLAEAPALPQAAATARPAPRITVIRDANLRGGPGTNYPRVATAASGDRFTVTGRTEKGDWLRITGGAVKEAWIAAFLAKVEGDLQAAPIAP